MERLTLVEAEGPFVHGGRRFVYEPARDPGTWTSTPTLLRYPVGADARR